MLLLFSGIPWDDWREGHNGVGGVLPDTIVLERLGDSVCYIEFIMLVSYTVNSLVCVGDKNFDVNISRSRNLGIPPHQIL